MVKSTVESTVESAKKPINEQIKDFMGNVDSDTCIAIVLVTGVLVLSLIIGGCCCFQSFCGIFKQKKPIAAVQSVQSVQSVPGPAGTDQVTKEGF